MTDTLDLPLLCTSTIVHRCCSSAKRLSNLTVYRVEIASTSSAAIEVLDRTPVAAVLLEYKMEGIDAEAAACHIKRRFPRVPIILLSAFPEIPERTLWLVDDYVMKSAQREGLVRVIERMTRYRASA